MRRAKVIESRISMMIVKEEKKKPRIKEKARIIFEEKGGKKGRNCLTLDSLEKSYDKTLFSNLNLMAKHGERIAVAGRQHF
ncbi:MAG: hypothetical protein GY760_28110 [Deltaproteobacteria bacterium]|nr:hypothetical protein [Deltaproteobacteria bacterium]